ncbi:MAG: HTTM domain-containing protein [Flavobacteriaceae bacterium]|nr:HTTM domain-containing protein [Flavobacteriaceae bacterium]
MNLSKIKEIVNQPIDIAGLVVFRITFGLILSWEIFRYFNHNWIKRYWIDPTFYFTYEGFSWVTPLTGDGMYYLFYFLGILAFFIAIGFLYRISTILFFLGFTYTFLLDKTNYLNHFYLIILLSFIMIFLPANRAFSIDAKIFPKIKRDWVPGWTLWWLRLQLGIVFFFGGVAKINSDWLQGEPMRKWLASRTDFPIIGQWFTEEWMVYLFTYSGLFIDLLIFPLLIFRKTRTLAIITLILFHLINAQLFSIGIFPWFMIGASTLFFPPNKLRFWKKLNVKKPNPFATSKCVLWGLGIYLLIQITIPLRHFLFKGNVSWTEEGHRFSWHMKLRSKSSTIKFYIVNSETKSTTKVTLSNYLTKRQRKKIKAKPDMIVQFAHFLAAEIIQEDQKNNVKITVNAQCGLNGRPKTYLIDTQIDLSKIKYPFYKKANWILPLDIPLK